MGKTLCLGGSFNPIHHAHLICARVAAETANFERVLLIPSSQPPHKPGDLSLASASDRLAMTHLAVAGQSLFDVDGLEVGRAGPSYTIDTARALKQRSTQIVSSEVHWLIGADLLPQLDTWHAAAVLLKEVTFWVIQRPGSPIDWAALSPMLQPLQDRLLVAPLIDISATQIRKRVAAGRSIDFLTPPAVVAYINHHQLYGSSGAGETR